MKTIEIECVVTATVELADGAEPDEVSEDITEQLRQSKPMHESYAVTKWEVE